MFQPGITDTTFNGEGSIPEEARLVSQVVVLQNLSPLSLQLLQTLLLFLGTIHVTLLQHPAGRETSAVSRLSLCTRVLVTRHQSEPRVLFQPTAKTSQCRDLIT